MMLRIYVALVLVHCIVNLISPIDWYQTFLSFVIYFQVLFFFIIHVEIFPLVRDMLDSKTYLTKFNVSRWNVASVWILSLVSTVEEWNRIEENKMKKNIDKMRRTKIGDYKDEKINLN